jgi:hypothetical protein
MVAFLVDVELGPELRFRTLTLADAEQLVEATRGEVQPALWGPRPAGPYTSPPRQQLGERSG